MRYLTFTLLALLPLISAQAPAAQGAAAPVQLLIPTNLPACAQQCTPLQQGETGCLPTGGAPISNQATYQSCFCQSGLLTQLYSANVAQVCTTCSPTDMATIQNWYKLLCGKSGTTTGAGSSGNSNANSNNVAAPAASAAAQTTSAAVAATASPIPSTLATTTGAPTPATQQGTWISSHYKWIIMIIVLILGLSSITVAGVLLHKRYHARREAAWGPAAPGSRPDINTWGPGQSVHDLRYTLGHGNGTNVSSLHTGGYGGEKGKSRL